MKIRLLTMSFMFRREKGLPLIKMIGSSRRFTQVYSSSRRSSYDGILSIVVLNVVDCVFDSTDHRNCHAEHLVREAAHAEVGSSLQLRFLGVISIRRANQVCVTRPRKVIVLDDAVQVEHQSVNVLVHEGNGRGCRVHKECLVGAIVGRLYGEHLGGGTVQ